jgi:hypothetical protein
MSYIFNAGEVNEKGGLNVVLLQQSDPPLIINNYDF